MTAPTRMKISDLGAAAACQRVMRSTMTNGKMLKASPKNARAKMPADPANGTHAQASSARGWCRSVTPTIANSTAVISGTGASSTMFGNENHLWNTKLLAPVPLMTAVLFAMVGVTLRHQPRADEAWAWVPFAGSGGIFVLAFFGLAFSIFPYVIVD